MPLRHYSNISLTSGQSTPQARSSSAATPASLTSAEGRAPPTGSTCHAPILAAPDHQPHFIFSTSLSALRYLLLLLASFTDV